MSTQKTILLSIFLTAFVLVILYGVVNRVSSVMAQQAAASADTNQPTAAPDTSTPTDQPTAQSSPTTLPPLSYDEAASLAATALGRKDVYSVETFIYQGKQSFKVVFGSGDVIYVGLDRQIIGRDAPAVTPTVQPTTAPAPAIIYLPPQPTAKHHPKNGGGGSPPPPPNNGGGEHDD